MVTIRKARLSDVEPILNLWEGLMGYHKKLDEKSFILKKNSKAIVKSFFIRNIKNKNSIVLIAEDRSALIGYLLGFIQKQPPVYEDDRHGYISDAFIKKEYRSKGIMGKMIKQAEDFFKGKGLVTLSAKVFVKNKKGLMAWKKMGLKTGAFDVFKTIKR